MSVLEDINQRQQDLLLLNYEHAIILGVGGIGSWVALNLALSGKIKNIHVIDPDLVESTNLNRTPFRLCDIGMLKVDAIKFLILERRAIEVFTYPEKSSVSLCKELRSITKIKERMAYAVEPDTYLDKDVVIVDCRDDVFDDFYTMQCKYYKLGYDGLEITIDGNPRNTAVWGRANNYRFVPSFICPAQLAANIAVIDILSCVPEEEIPEDVITNSSSFDLTGRLNKTFTYDTRNLVELLYRTCNIKTEKENLNGD
jgi:hypothetical protein